MKNKFVIVCLIIFNQLFQDDKRFQLFQFPIKDWGGERIKKMSNELFDEREVLNKDRNDILESMVASCCLASKRNGFVIDPELKVYKCHHYIHLHLLETFYYSLVNLH